MVGCTPRACEERLKKLRKLAKGWAFVDCGGKVGGRGGSGGNVGRKEGKKRTEKERAVERRSSRSCEPPGDIPALRQEEGESTTTIVTNIPVVMGNSGYESRLQDQDTHNGNGERTPALLPALPIKPDPSDPPPARHRSTEWVKEKEEGDWEGRIGKRV
ncbi:unnamed protein product [Tuber aestivum]|uniref:Uncharacterized protein n=1 Tax=Tuber aestivum TaxID=59557 RepID=A0A292PT56_9PEZI|nr:unnamed protein product [Tuber aestivum]